MSTIKVCGRCSKSKPTSEFPKNKRSSDGLYHQCKPCKAEVMREIKARPESERRKPPPVSPLGQKFCHGCETHKPVEEFYKCKGREDGLQTRCKVCKLKDNTASNARSVELSRKRQRKFREKDPAAWLAYQQKWRAANRDKVNKANKKWRDANPDKVMASVHRRRARLAAAEGIFTQYQWKKKKAEYGGCCAYCGVPGRQSLHHVVPLSKGGSNWIENIVPACLSCNLKIGTRTVYPGAKDGVCISTAG